MTNEEIIAAGQQIYDETEVAANTSERVGGVIKGIGQNLAEKDTAIAAEAARNGYYQCTVSGTTLAVSAPGFTLPAHGGNIRIKMSAPATGASTLNINSTGPKQLLYNGAALSSANTWEKDEIISVFYDGTRFMASNAQGGDGDGGKKKLIPIDNYFINTSGTSVPSPTYNQNYNYVKYPVNEGDIVYISAQGSNTENARIWAIADNNGVFIDKAEIGGVEEDVLLIMPANAKWIILNNRKASYPNQQWYYAKVGSAGADAMLARRAQHVSYNNSQSGIAATNVQDGIDELSQNSAREIKCTWYQGTIKGLDGSDKAAITRLRSEYIGVKKGNIIMVTPNGQNVAIYLYNTDKTSALGAYAKGLINTDYTYTCPQDGYVRFVAAKADTSETMIPSELLADITICPPVYMPCLVNNKVLTSTDFTQGAIKGADGSDNAATTRLRSEYYPIRKGDIINVEYNSQKVRIVTYNVDKTLLYDSLWYDKRNYIVTQDGFVRFSLRKEDDSETFLPSELTASISLPIRNDIIDLNDGDNLIPTIKRQPRLNNTTQGNVLTFLHFTDIHLGRNFELARLIKFKNRYNTWIDDILNTGDLQDRGFESGISWFNQVDGHENILNVIGNHDAYKSPATNWKYETSINVYNRFIAPYVSNWGVTQPSGAPSSGLNYWYKDYSSYNIRLIAIDCVYWNATQNTWLQNTLNSVPSGWSVICASHFKPSMTFIDCNMTDLILQPSTMAGTLDAEATDTVQNFIDNGGKFICWICGHEHKDYVGTVLTHSDQLVIGCATASMGSNRTIYCVMDRVDGMKSQDLFNIIGFDTYNKHIRILRVGADFDIFMRSKKTLCINYETHDIIAQS